ncbi:lytic transglycosylase domain-containing protein [Primorskyibacter flagellatus]|uniref:Membrane-bound lytic murein transglycosylase B n=1 Tax=Primorskyibacter flagellatus TaxID=1387277 RepID=A0A1W1Z1K0_9RHOB|nr:lytic murein transglycosylase [Primorskyibacter flagellatus]SMC42335.1 Membrane-bound lytic murein transglycosylase B [Primorskyibacter flagellatus]
MRPIFTALFLSLLTASPALAANCITNKGSFGAYKQGLSQQAASNGVGQSGLQALGSASLSSLTWRFESNPSSQSGVSYGDPAAFLAKRSGSSAQSFINMARSKKSKNPNTFSSIERTYGVPADLLVTIWGLETSWGGYLGKTPIVDGAVTLASYCRRHPRFEGSAIAALKLVDRGVISTSTQGGPSGELGHMQFLAENWLRYGVDANGDGKADPYSAVDALASAANMLRQNGWQPGQPYGEGTRNFQALSAWNDSGNYQRAIVYAAQRIGG